MINERIANYLVKKRKEKKLTQAQLAEKVGVSEKGIDSWENGLSIPDVYYIDPLCKALGITVNELVNGGKSKSVLTEEESKLLLELSSEQRVTKTPIHDVKVFLNALMQISTWITVMISFVFSYCTLHMLSNGFETLSTTGMDMASYLLVIILVCSCVVVVLFEIITLAMVKVDSKNQKRK